MLRALKLPDLQMLPDKSVWLCGMMVKCSGDVWFSFMYLTVYELVYEALVLSFEWLRNFLQINDVKQPIEGDRKNCKKSRV